MAARIVPSASILSRSLDGRLNLGVLPIAVRWAMPRVPRRLRPLLGCKVMYPTEERLKTPSAVIAFVPVSRPALVRLLRSSQPYDTSFAASTSRGRSADEERFVE
jgi:hypothetical protein